MIKIKFVNQKNIYNFTSEINSLSEKWTLKSQRMTTMNFDNRKENINNTFKCTHRCGTSQKLEIVQSQSHARLAFVISGHRELVSILPLLIVLSKNQKVTIQPTDSLNILTCSD